MTLRHAILVFLAAAHLTYAGFAAFSWPLLPSQPQLNRAVRLYGAVSGSENRFGFFAPDVGWLVRAKFQLTDKTGRTWTDTLERGPNRECNLRLMGIVDTMFALEIEDEVQVQSWAAAMLGRHPAAETCTVMIETYQTPRMPEYRMGQRPKWVV